MANNKNELSLFGECQVMSECLSIQDLEQLLICSGSPEQLTKWKRHLRVCDFCASAFARKQAGLETMLDSNQETPEQGKFDSKIQIPGNLEPNIKIGDFRIEERLGTGGMGVVYKALQVSLNRHVALKVLQAGLAMSGSAVQRFHREAQAAAKLHHTNIVGIYAEGEEGGICYYAMEIIEGRSLDKVIADLRVLHSKHQHPDTAIETATDIFGQDDFTHISENFPLQANLGHDLLGPNYFDTVARLISDIGDALDYAHKKGVIHLDVKPSNLILDNNGKISLMDFGVARMFDYQGLTVTGTFIGTVQYMSPEQLLLKRSELDHRVDIYSLGVTLYELLTLQLPFNGDHREQVITQILKAEPRKPRQIDSRIPIDLETICCKAMEKDPQRRYQTAGDFADDLHRYINDYVIKAKRSGPVDKIIKFIHRNKLTTVLSMIILVVVAITGITGWKYFTVHWVQYQAIPQILDLVEKKDYFDAFILTQKARRYSSDDPSLVSLWSQISTEIDINSTPTGAKIYYSKYSADQPDWKYLGHSPLSKTRIPCGTCRWKIIREGFQEIECVCTNDLSSEKNAGELHFTLHERSKFPQDMVWIPSSDLSQHNLYHGQRVISNAPNFLIDKYEVTNQKFKQFVDAGGYQNPSYWQEPFIKDGKVLSFQEAMQFFIDSTGQPGPASWINGSYPANQQNYPVGGVSWYEASACAKFQDKILPTAYHWRFAAVENFAEFRICSLGNYSNGPAPVGTYRGMGQFGLYDVAGNVREWCYNTLEEKENLRCILGGGWNDPTYLLTDGMAISAWDREITNGFRCAKYLGGEENVPPMAFTPLENKSRDFSKFKPFSYETFRMYADTLYRYEKTPLNAVVESSEDLGYCRRERISFDAAYPDERVIVFLHIPKNSIPPYQTVIWFPGGGARFTEWGRSSAYSKELVNIIKSGRAVMFPMYKGTYDRRLKIPYSVTYGLVVRDLYIKQSQDLRRSIDYLETRDDININKLAYAGISWGAHAGCIMMALEERFKTGILLHGGICGCKREPTSDCANFAPHVKQPVLMINSKYDNHFPYESAQKPMFELLGTSTSDKKHILLEAGGHGTPLPEDHKKEYYKVFLDWLDTYLGQVSTTSTNNLYE